MGSPKIRTVTAGFCPGLGGGTVPQEIGHWGGHRLIVPEEAAALELNLQPFVNKGAVVTQRWGVI